MLEFILCLVIELDRQDVVRIVVETLAALKLITDNDVETLVDEIKERVYHDVVEHVTTVSNVEVAQL